MSVLLGRGLIWENQGNRYDNRYLLSKQKSSTNKYKRIGPIKQLIFVINWYKENDTND